MAKKKKNWPKLIGNSYIILLSVFVTTFFLLNEWFDLDLKPVIIISLSLFISALLIFLSKKINISDYILLPVILIDGYFHLTSPLENLVENSPDWVLAFNLYGSNGMPVIVHQLMGVFLICTSSFFIYFLASKNKSRFLKFYKYVIAIVTLTIISLSYIIKLFR